MAEWCSPRMARYCCGLTVKRSRAVFEIGPGTKESARVVLSTYLSSAVDNIMLSVVTHIAD